VLRTYTGTYAEGVHFASEASTVPGGTREQREPYCEYNERSEIKSLKDMTQGNDGFVSWAGAIPQKQGLYDPEFEKDACGVGFVCHIKGAPSHKVVHDGKSLLCNMTHRGAVGADARDGDGAGIMCSIPHDFFAKEVKQKFDITLPQPGHYAVGNVYLKPDEQVLKESQDTFEAIAQKLHLRVLCWRPVPRDNSILGPASKSKEPIIMQPFVVLDHPEKSQPSSFDYVFFERQLYLLRKQSTHAITLARWFYICSLSNKNIVYKGLLAPVQVYAYFDDLANEDFKSHFCLVHSRFSTNTFPSWDRAQPMRWCAHNGEINTLRGNKNWMRAREGVMHSENFKELLETLYPIIEEGGSDSAAFDNVLELLVMNGVFSLPEAVMVMVPEAWQNQPNMEPEKRAFYEWAACLMEPWDGPALFTFSDGRYVGACLDRNGLRPCRFYITNEDIMICASEVGTIVVDPAIVTEKGRLQPGKMLLVDTSEGRVVDDRELKMGMATSQPYGQWLEDNMITMMRIRESVRASGQWTNPVLDESSIAEDKRMLAFGFTVENLNMIVTPMVNDGKEALGSMGHDAPLACLSRQPRLIYEYFRQLFAQ
ncbi:glutamate synthase [NADH], partial [Quaeritorhiza haematococci]